MVDIGRLAVLNEILELFLEPHTSIPEFLRKVLIKANQQVASDLGFVGVVEEIQGENWVVVWNPADDIVGACSGDWTKYFGRLRVGAETLPQSERSFVGYVAATKCARKSDDVRKEAFYRTSNEEVRSELAVPVLLGEEILAVINLESKTLAFFSDQDVEFLQMIARLIAFPLHFLMIGEGMRRPMLTTLESLGEIFTRLPPGISLEASGLLSDAARVIGAALNSDCCLIWLLNSSHDLALQGVFATQAEEASNGASWVTKEGFARQAVEQRAVVKFGHSYQRDANPSSEPSSLDAAHFPLMATPILASGEVVGAIVIASRRVMPEHPQPYYTGADEHLLSTIQTQLGSSIQLKRIEFDQREQSLQRSRQVSLISGIFTDLDLGSVLQKVVLRVSELCQSRYCSIFLWSEARRAFVLAASNGLAADLIGEASYAPGEGLTGWVGLHGKPLVLDRRAPANLACVATDLSWKAKWVEGGPIEDLTMRPFAAVPIFQDGDSRGKPVGILRLSDRDTGFFTETDEFVMRLVASKISTAVGYSDRYEERVRLLRGLQELMEYTRRFPRELDDIDAFKRSVLGQAARCATEVYRADVVTIYGVNQGTIESPPVCCGTFRHPARMRGSVRSYAVPSFVLSGNQSLYWEDARSNQLLVGVPPVRNEHFSGPRFVQREGIVSSAGVRLGIGDTVMGIMFLNYRTPKVFDSSRQELIGSFGAAVALCLETVSLYYQIRESPSAEELSELAGSLHDTVTLLSLGVVNRTGSILDSLKAKPSLSKIHANLRTIEKCASDCSAELRGVLGELQPTGSDQGTIIDALKTYAKMMIPPDVDFDLQVGNLVPLPPNVSRQMILVARELLGNALAHAVARHISLFLDTTADNFLLRIEDDGVGFEPKRALQKHSSLGFRVIIRRIDSIHGRLRINSARGKGSVITVEVPIKGGTANGESIKDI